jgi:hypothetical protein
MNKFRKLGFIDYNGHIEVHSSLLNLESCAGRHPGLGSKLGARVQSFYTQALLPTAKIVEHWGN